jgi:hypothetical protein
MLRDIIKVLKITLTSLAIAALVLFLTRFERVFSCPAYEVFGGKSHTEDLLVFLTGMGIAILIWSIGVFLFVSIIQIRKHTNIYLYFILLTILSMTHIIKYRVAYETPIINLAMREAICKKGTATSMDASFTDLIEEEYIHIQSKERWLPPLPNRADSICIKYYHDSFTGDFDLTIDFKLPNNMTLDSTQIAKFKLTSNGYQFHDFEM